MKKKILLISILAVLISLTGCSGQKETEETETYNKNILSYQMRDIVDQYRNLSDAETEYYLSEGSELDVSAAKGFRQIQTTDKVGSFLKFDMNGEMTIEPGADDMILVSMTCNYQNRDVKIAVSFKKDLNYQVDYEQLYQQLSLEAAAEGQTVKEYIVSVNRKSGIPYDTSSVDNWIAEYLYNNDYSTPYMPVECEVTAIYTKGELMKKAAQNTAIGMITVFLVLIFISFVISLLKYIPKILGMDKKKEKKEAPKPAAPKPKPVPAPAAPAPFPKEENLMQDKELVAVITAAVYAMAGSEKPANAESKDKLIVRSIRRARL